MSTRQGGRPHRAVSAATALAAVLVVTAGASVVLLYPSLAGGGGVTTSITSRPPNETSTSASITTYPTLTTTATSTQRQGGWQPWAVANITLDYYRVQAYIHDAYNYSLFMSQTGANPVLVSALVNTFGPQQISGNWTTGYNLTFSYHSELNVTVQYTSPSNYQIIHFAAQNFTLSAYWSVQYDSTQQKEISIAISNAGVKSYLSQHPSFVDGVFLFPTANKTFGGDYLVMLYQTDGARILGVFVNPNTGSVVSTYQSSRATETCLSNNYCYTSPWGS